MRAALAALLLCVVAPAVRAEDAPAPAASPLAVPEPVYDAGKIERGVALRHAFIVKNLGTTELSIDAKPG